MIRLLVKVPRKVYVACSGGVDSMAALHFLRNNHDVTLAFFHHGTETSDQAHQFLREHARMTGIPMISESIRVQRPRGASLEEHWREQRYDWLNCLDGHVVTAHHLDDAVETWVWSSMHGEAKLPMIWRERVIRPFLGTRKVDLENYCRQNMVPWLDDHTNGDMRFTRNYIRHEMMPHVLRVNPGIHKMIRKRLLLAAQEIG